MMTHVERSRTVVQTLDRVDPQFRALVSKLYGDAVDPDALYERVFKANPDPADTQPRKARAVKANKWVPVETVEKASVRAMANGITQKLTGMLPSSLQLRNGKVFSAQATAARNAPRTTPAPPGTNTGNVNAGRAVGDFLGTKTGKVAAGAVAGKQVYDVRQKRKAAAEQQPSFDPYGATDNYSGYAKADVTDVTWEATFSKLDDDKRLAFGWASVVKMNGSPVIDCQGDVITPEDLEQAAYTYVQHSRKGGHMHKRDELDQPVHVSDIVESIVFTDEKIAKMGLPDSMPRGWWIGTKIHDDEVWKSVKDGTLSGFSIHGKGRRQPMTTDQAMGYS